MGIVLSLLGLEEKSTYDSPPKKLLFTLNGVQITLAHSINILISILVVILIILLEFGYIPAHKQGFFCNDPLISFKYNGDTIAPETLGITAFFLPVFIVICTELLAHQSFKKINLFVIFFYVQECLVGAILVLLLTSVAKNIVGEHRPHFFDTCRPNTAMNCTTGEFIESYKCTSNDYDDMFIIDASLSFPSGHSSISWFIGIYLCYVIHIRTIVVNAGYIMKPFLISVVLSWSMLCSLSRITDRRHHWWDVLAGSLFGVFAALYYTFVVYEKIKKNDRLVQQYDLTEEIQLTQRNIL